MGRPRRKFTEKDIEQIKTLARCHCPDSEIAAFMSCGEMTIRRRFGTLIKAERESGKASIRAKQFQLAMKGDKTMLVWLGKQLLGQYEPRNQEETPLPVLSGVASYDDTERLSTAELISLIITKRAEMDRRTKDAIQITEAKGIPICESPESSEVVRPRQPEPVYPDIAGLQQVTCFEPDGDA